MRRRRRRSSTSIAAPTALRVVHLIKHVHRGNGHVHVAVDLACAQAARGMEVWFATAGGDYLDLLEQHGVRVVRLPEPTSFRSTARTLWPLFRLITRVRPDILHAHMMSSAVIGAIVTKASRTALVTTVHNSFDPHSRLMRLGDLVVAVSRAERDLLVDRGFDSTKLAVVWNGPIGTPRSALVDEQELTLHTPAITGLSGLHARKGVDHVVRAFARAVTDYPDWHLNLIGGGPDAERLRSLIASLHIERNAHLLGSSRSPRRLLERSEIFVSGALAEPFGLNLVEAREAGCAIIASRTGGIVEVLDHGAAGILVAPGDEVELAASMRSLMGSTPLRQSLATRAAAGLDRFSVERMALEYEVVYRRARHRFPVERASEDLRARARQSRGSSDASTRST